MKRERERIVRTLWKQTQTEAKKANILQEARDVSLMVCRLLMSSHIEGLLSVCLYIATPGLLLSGRSSFRSCANKYPVLK